MPVPLSNLEYTDRVLKRAQYEAFEFAVDGRTVTVRNGSHANPEEHEYEIHVEDGLPISCTCPADAQYEGACKHRVGVAIRTAVLQACATAQVAVDCGRLMHGPAADRVDCQQCTALGKFPCWYCVRTGRRELPT